MAVALCFFFWLFTCVVVWMLEIWSHPTTAGLGLGTFELGIHSANSILLLEILSNSPDIARDRYNSCAVALPVLAAESILARLGHMERTSADGSQGVVISGFNCLWLQRSATQFGVHVRSDGRISDKASTKPGRTTTVMPSWPASKAFNLYCGISIGFQQRTSFSLGRVLGFLRSEDCNGREVLQLTAA